MKKITNHIRTITSATTAFDFHNVAMWALKKLEPFAKSDEVKPENNDGDDTLQSAIYGQLIFNLYVYLEGSFNNSLRRHLKTTQRLRKKDNHIAYEFAGLILEKVNRNITPLETLELFDKWNNTTIVAEIKSSFGESIKYHSKIRNFIAHGLDTSTEIIIEHGGAEASYSFQEPEEEIKKLIAFFNKKSIYKPMDFPNRQEGDSLYPTTFLHKETYHYFKENISSLMNRIIELDPDKKLNKNLMFGFDFKFFNVKCPLD